MRVTLKNRWTGEPLLHFVLLGAFTFGAWSLFGANPAPGQHIEISAFDLERMRAMSVRQWGQQPGPAQLRELVERHVREEVLYREAIRSGMDRDDVIVRRRLAQKMEFLAQDEVALPAEPVLAAWFEQHAQRYAVAPTVSFEHVLFSARLHGAAAPEVARRALAALRPGQAPGGGSAMLPASYDKQGEALLARDFGPAFAQALFALRGQGWSGPVLSPYGAHLVRLKAQDAVLPATLDAVRAQVQADWLNEHAGQARENAYARLRARYVVSVSGESGAAR